MSKLAREREREGRTRKRERKISTMQMDGFQAKGSKLINQISKIAIDISIKELAYSSFASLVRRLRPPIPFALAGVSRC